MAALYQELINMFVRPYRQQYTNFDLGSVYVENSGKRIDFEITNHKGHKLKCSYYIPINKPKTSQCVVYLHSMNGSRLEGSRLPSYFLKYQDTSFATIDLSGSGNSEGDYVSLGCHQSRDALCLLEHLHKTYKIQRFAVWGRSMGAATAIKVADEYNRHNHASTTSVPTRPYEWNLRCLILDSPFSNVTELAVEIADKKVNIPSFLIKAGFLLIKKSVEAKADFKFEQLQMQPIVKRLENTPLFIMASPQDELIDFKHSQKIFDNYACVDKQFSVIEGGHNQFRTDQIIFKVVAYARKKLSSSHKKEVEARPSMSNRDIILSSRKQITWARPTEGTNKDRERSLRGSDVYVQAFPTSQLIPHQVSIVQENSVNIRPRSRRSQLSIREQKGSNRSRSDNIVVSTQKRDSLQNQPAGTRRPYISIRKNTVAVMNTKSEKHIRYIDLSPFCEKQGPDSRKVNTAQGKTHRQVDFEQLKRMTRKQPQRRLYLASAENIPTFHSRKHIELRDPSPFRSFEGDLNSNNHRTLVNLKPDLIQPEKPVQTHREQPQLQESPQPVPPKGEAIQLRKSLLASSSLGTCTAKKIQISDKDHYNVIYSKLNNMRRKNNVSIPNPNYFSAGSQPQEQQQQRFTVESGPASILLYATPVKAPFATQNFPQEKDPRIMASAINSFQSTAAKRPQLQPSPMKQNAESHRALNSGSPRVPYLISNERRQIVDHNRSQQKSGGVRVTSKQRIKINVPQFTP